MNIFKQGKKQRFQHICRANDIMLDYRENKSEFAILSEIFEQRSYADYFPFYQKAIVVDVGAHVGYFSLFAQKNTRQDSTIVSIEIDQENFKQLNKNIAINNISNIETLYCGIGKQSGSTKLYKGASVNHSILEDYAFVHSEKVSESVELKTIEEIVRERSLPRIDFLKLDCEGAEYQILESMSSAVFQMIDVISMEFHDLKHEQYNGEFLRTLLLKNNFEIVKFEHGPTSMGMNYGKIVAIQNR